MRYLRKQVLNRRAPFDDRLAVDVTNSIVMHTTNNMLMPKGIQSQRPVTPVTGMMRYNTTTDNVEVYQGSSAQWRSLRFKEATQIVSHTLGVGDSIETLFGPLNPAPPTIVESGTTWSGANIIVIVENVIQIFTTNYTISINPVGHASGSYVLFDSPVPLGKAVTVLHGFDK